MPAHNYIKQSLPKVDIVKIRDILEKDYHMEHDAAEGIAKVINIALKDQDLSGKFATKEDITKVDVRIDRVIDKIDHLEQMMDLRFKSAEVNMDAKFAIMEAKFETMEQKIESAKKSTIIWLGSIISIGFISMISVLLKYLPVIAKLIEMTSHQ